ncbi:MAG: CBS domain-containing protein [Parvibaculaceae bacterium]
MTVATLLNEKGASVVTAREDTSLAEIANLLSENRIGAVVIADGQRRPVGIVSERDIVHVIAKEGPGALGKKAGDVMIRKLITCGPEDTIYEIMNLMTRHRIRHLPIVVDGKLGGIISIGDVVKSRIAEVELEATEMKRYIAG